jgi:hypothetical protein
MIQRYTAFHIASRNRLDDRHGSYAYMSCSASPIAQLTTVMMQGLSTNIHNRIHSRIAHAKDKQSLALSKIWMDALQKVRIQGALSQYHLASKRAVSES